MRSRAVRIVIGRLFRHIALVAPGVSRTTFLSNVRVHGRRRVRVTTRGLLILKYHTMLVGNNRLRNGRVTSVLFARSRTPLQLTIPAVRARGARNANYALSSTVTTCVTLKGRLPSTMHTTGSCVATTLRTKTGIRAKRKRKPLGRFFSPIPLVGVRM